MKPTLPLAHSSPAEVPLQANLRVPAARGLAPSLLQRAAELRLDWDTRSRSRFAARDSLGRSIAVILPRGSVLRDGDALVAVDGSLLRVRAARQALLQVRADDALALLRAAYHLGNRHVALQLGCDVLQLEPDPVLADMLGRMGLRVEAALAPFEPESGAYEGHGQAPAASPRDRHRAAHDHGHDHGHDHAHDHAHHHAPGTAES